MQNYLIVTFPTGGRLDVIRRQLEIAALDHITRWTGLKWIGAFIHLNERAVYVYDLGEYRYRPFQMEAIGNAMPKGGMVYQETLPDNHSLKSNWKVL